MRKTAFLVPAICLTVASAAFAQQSHEDWADCVQNDDQDKSIAGCTRIIERGGETPRNLAAAYGNRGNAFFRKRDYDRAILEYNESIRLSPQTSKYYSDRGAVFFRTDDVDRAFSDAESALRLDGKNANAYFVRGNALTQKKEYDRALADADAAIRLNDTSANAHHLRGNVLTQKKEYDLAMESYKRALSINPRSADIYHSRSALHFYKRDFAACVEDATRAIELDPNNPGTHYNRAIAYEALHDKASALRDFLRASELEPGKEEFAAGVTRMRAALAGKPAAPSPPPPPPGSAAKSPVAEEPTPSPGSAPARAPKAERRVALVIGNGDYEAVAPLRNPKKDAVLIAEALRKAGFQTGEPAINLTLPQMIKRVQQFEQEADGADWALVYYAGHGVEIGGQNYVLPVDARLASDRHVRDEALTLNRLIDAAGGARTLRIVILDACRENPFERSMRRTVATRAVTRGLTTPPEQSVGTQVVYAARSGELALDGTGENSPFASALARRLVEPRVDVRRVFGRVTADVMKSTANRQQPFVYGSLPGDDDFYFMP